jgi:hypothetical protein
MATKFEQLCAAYQASRDGFTAYRAECTAFLLRVGHQLESTWEVPALRLADAAFDPATGLFRLEASFDVHAGHDAKQDARTAKLTRTVTLPLAARKEGNGFLLSVDDGAPVNVGGGSDAEVAPVLDEAFGRVVARFEQDPRKVRDLDPTDHAAGPPAVTPG